jgi:hypothetical protein
VFHPAKRNVIVPSLLVLAALERVEHVGEPVGAELKPLLADIHELRLAMPWEGIMTAAPALDIHLLNLAVWVGNACFGL